VVIADDDRGWRPRSTRRDGALAHERDGYRVGANAVAGDAAGGVASVENNVLVSGEH